MSLHIQKFNLSLIAILTIIFVIAILIGAVLKIDMAILIVFSSGISASLGILGTLMIPTKPDAVIPNQLQSKQTITVEKTDQISGEEHGESTGDNTNNTNTGDVAIRGGIS